MKKLFFCVAVFMFSEVSMGQRITISFRQPEPNQVIDTLLNVRVFVSSTLPLASLTADVEGRVAVLTPSAGPTSAAYDGDISLLGLPQNTLLQVSVTAIDTAGNRQTATQSFIYDRPPVITVDSPLSYSVARPYVHVRARCTDSMGCFLRVKWNNTNPDWNWIQIPPGDAQVDTLIDLSAYNGTQGSLDIVAWDWLAQTSHVSKLTLADSSPWLVESYAARDLIEDFQYHQLLVTNPWRGAGDYTITPDLNPYAYRNRVVNIITGDTVPIPYGGVLSTGNAVNRITPYGVLLSAYDSAGLPAKLYDWNRGGMYDLGGLNGGISLRVAGRYALWSNGDSLHFRNLETMQDTVLSYEAGNDDNDVAANGSVVYWSKDYHIYRVRDGQSTILERNNDEKDFDPITDGQYIVYTRWGPSGYAIHFYNGRTDTMLSDQGSRMPDAGTDDQVNNGYVAFTRRDSAGVLQVWLRDTNGVYRQMTDGLTDSRIDRLGVDGNIIIVGKAASGKNRRFFADRRTGLVTELCSTLGRVYYRDSGWYVCMGRILYSLNTASLPHPPAQPIVTGMKDSFCINAGVQTIRVVNFPDTAAGNLVIATLDGVALAPGADSSYSFAISGLIAGNHRLEVRYANAYGSSEWAGSFTVAPADTPTVRLSSNITEVMSLADTIALTATNRRGGGNMPLYTFAADRNFIFILQSQGPRSSLTLLPAMLVVGVNWFYVRMRTSDSCYARPEDVDSVMVERSAVTGIIDPEFPHVPIVLAPDPFVGTFRISGLHNGKLYWVVIRNSLGQKVFEQVLRDAPVSMIAPGMLSSGIYWVSIYDRKRRQAIGTIRLLKQ